MIRARSSWSRAWRAEGGAEGGCAGTPTCRSEPDSLGALGWAGAKLRAWAELLRLKLALREREDVPGAAPPLQLPEPRPRPGPRPLRITTARPASGTA